MPRHLIEIIGDGGDHVLVIGHTPDWCSPIQVLHVDDLPGFLEATRTLRRMLAEPPKPHLTLVEGGDDGAA